MSDNKNFDQLPPLWLNDIQVAVLLGLTPQCLRKWRVLDRRAGLGDGRPGRGGLRWRRFGRSIRYDPRTVLPPSTGMAMPDSADVGPEAA